MKVYIRADASNTIGTGHIFRTLVLSETFKSDQIAYFCRDYEGLPKKRILDKGYALNLIPPDISIQEEQDYLLAAMQKESPDWVVFDNYDIKEDYFSAVGQTGVKIFAIDDINHTRFPVDILLNQNVGSENYAYECRKDTVKLLGPHFALVNSECQHSRDSAQPRTSLNSLLIFMGGADPNNETLKVLKGLEKTKKTYEVNIVLGSAFQYRETIEEFIKTHSFKCQLHENLPNLTELMLRSDLAIGAGGSSSWEMCTLYLPMLIIPIAENQYDIAKELSQAGIALSPGIADKVTAEDISRIIDSISDEKLNDMSQKAGSVCDGLGANRILEHLTD